MYRSEVFHVHGVTESLKRMKERGRENGVDRCTCHVEGMITNKRPMAKNHGQPPCHEKEKKRKGLDDSNTTRQKKRSGKHAQRQQLTKGEDRKTKNYKYMEQDGMRGEVRCTAQRNRIRRVRGRWYNMPLEYGQVTGRHAREGNKLDG